MREGRTWQEGHTETEDTRERNEALCIDDQSKANFHEHTRVGLRECVFMLIHACGHTYNNCIHE